MNIYNIVGLLLLFIFYFIYFVKIYFLKKQGISANRLAKGNKSVKIRILEAFLLIVTYSMALIQVLSILYFQNYFIVSISRIPGLIIAFIGICYFAVAVKTMKTNWRAGIDKTQTTELVRTGVYKYSRNPAFLGFDSFYIGIAFAFANIYILVLCAIAVILLHLQILEEEKYLKTIFGAEYEDYKNSTPRYCSITI